MEKTGGGPEAAYATRATARTPQEPTPRRSLMGSAARALMVAGFLAGIGGVGSGCLTRKVSGEPPTTKINYNTRIRQSAIDKLDLLFAIDNSSSMGDKQKLFSEAVPALITRLLTPDCISDSNGGVVERVGGACPTGSKPEFEPVQDIHIAIVSSSLGDRGTGATCGTDTTRFDDDKGRLLNRPPTADTAPSNFLAWLPPVEKNKEKRAKLKKGEDVTPQDDQQLLVNDFSSLVVGVGQNGCGYEAQLESAYRFLVQPDPYESISLVPSGGDQIAQLNGVDNTILAQRAKFLREDSLVAIIMLTDENESNVDPLAVGGHGYYYTDRSTHVAGGTAACAQNPNDDACFSCYQTNAKGKPECRDANDQVIPLSDKDDNPNVRFYEMKRRFGVDPRYPIERYINGFSKAKVPDRRGEHPANAEGKPSFNYVGQTNCTSPLFAKNLPKDGKADAAGLDALCNLPKGSRTDDLVFLAVIGGVPWQLLTTKPDDLTDDNKAEFKDSLDVTDWNRILGPDPLHYKFDGINARMRESIAKRAGLAEASTSGAANGGEWDTAFKDLQYACTFKLPTPRDCTNKAEKDACDCSTDDSGNLLSQSSLCELDPKSGKKTLQTRGKAYPTVSELSVARALDKQGIVASLCPRSLEGGVKNPTYGYNPAVRTIINRLKDALNERCIPQPLEEASDGTVPCLVLERLPQTGDQATACDPAKNREQPDPGILARYKEQLKNDGEPQEVLDQPVCAIKQLTGTQLVNNSCVNSTKGGWCYVTRKKSPNEKCAQAVKFSNQDKPVNGATIDLACIEEPPKTAGGDGGTP
ncbi:hypothetical protein [Pendulispora albinea]|uniref:VWFA domain-containing protein n=1 Tax=Pendulispora albinea TaxID=2741071 RepID=A0ABZ2M893_9BACT